MAIAAMDTKYRMAPYKYSRAAVTSNMVKIAIRFCGMCHSDLHAVNGDWGVKPYPVSPGHEIAGVVQEVGDEVKEFQVGDRVGVGCMVDSCKKCDMCNANLEQHCDNGATFTYDSKPTEERGYKDGTAGQPTRGGYSSQITVHKRFVFKIPETLKLEEAGPLLCAGITMYSPLNRFVKGKANQRVGIVGFGGLGHMGVKIAKAMGASVAVFSRNNKKKEAAAALGADLIVTSNEEELKTHMNKFDFILDTISAEHDLSGVVRCLKTMGNYCIVGLSAKISSHPGAFVGARRSLHGSNIGGCEETAEMLEFCAKHQIKPEIEVIPCSQCTSALDELEKGTAGSKRFVLDMSTMQAFHDEPTQKKEKKGQ